MLPQPLLIFRKDLEHLWPETLIVVVLFAAFCFAAPSGWAGSDYAGYVSILSAFLKFFLMPVSWVVVIARLVQDEPLVGDRQFWTSRPYDSVQLLLSKVLYLLVFLYLPFLLMQAYLLKHAGLHPLLAIPALLHNLLLLTVVVVIPVMAISAVTSTFPRMLLTVVGTMIALLVLAGFFGYFNALRMLSPHLDWLASTIFILLPAAALLLQYRTRKTALARGILIATPLVAVLVFLLAPTTALIEHGYPAASGPGAPDLSLLTGPEAVPPKPEGDLLKMRDHVILRIPLRVTGVDDRNDFTATGVRVTVSAPGVQYASPFYGALGPRIGGASPFAMAIFYLPARIFDQVRNTPADLRLQFATEHVAVDQTQTWKATGPRFDVPGHGVCSFPGPQDLTQQVTCRYAFSPPQVSAVQARVSAGACSQPGSPSVPGRAQLGGKSAMLELDPVVTVPLTFQTGDPNPEHIYTLCPGTDLHLVGVKELPDSSLAVEVKGITLDPYAVRRATVLAAAPSGAPQAQ